MTLQNRDWRYRVSKARTQLILRQPFFGALAMRGTVIEATPTEHPDIDTAATDGQNYFFSPKFVDSISDEHLLFVMAHEVMHVALLHPTRLQNREPVRANIAMDHVVNLALKDAGFKVLPQAYQDPQYKGLSFEQVYARLPPTPPKSSPSSNPDPTRCGAVRAPSKDPAKCQAVEDEIKISISQAVAVARAAGIGKFPAFVDMILDGLKPRPSARLQLREFLASNFYTLQSWARPNKKKLTLAPRQIFPSNIPAAIPHLVIAVDTSGSMFSPRQLKEAFSDITAIANEYSIQRITVLYADTKVHRIETFEYGEDITANPKGGGGTDFRDAFNKINALDTPPTVVLFFTDLEVMQFGTEPECPTLWCVYNTESAFARLSARAPFGQAIHLTDY